MPKHDPSERTKTEILETAARLFGEKGWDSVNIEDIVKEVGVTRGAFYHYFKSREELIIAVSDKMFYDNNPFTAAEKEKNLNALEKLRLTLNLDLNTALLESGRLKELLKVFESPIVFKGEFIAQLNTVAPFIEKLLIEGNKDGSMSVRFPKQTAQIIALLSSMWLRHDMMQITSREFTERLLFLTHLYELLGVSFMDNELEERVLKNFENFTGKE